MDKESQLRVELRRLDDRGRHGPDQWGLLKQRDERRQPDRLPELRRGQERPLRQRALPGGELRRGAPADDEDEGLDSGRPTEETIVDTQYDYYNGGANNGRIQRITDNVDSAYSTTFSL